MMNDLLRLAASIDLGEAAIAESAKHVQQLQSDDGPLGDWYDQLWNCQSRLRWLAECFRKAAQGKAGVPCQ